jgi:alkylated DNA nucleotide flippase Atl1
VKILILGGYGVFGGRLATLLADLGELELLIAGRDLARAETFCSAYAGAARVDPIRLARRDISAALQTHRPDLVVDASGPFQEYGADRYQVIEACIECGTDYLDFADAADFVFGVRQFDSRAREAGVFVLSGVSSFPVLTAAVLREMAQGMDIVAVEGGIAPSPYAGIGLNVMRAVLGYAGSPVMLLRGGRKAQGTGLAESMRFTVAVPGRLPLRNIRFSLVDVPDLRVIPPEHATMTDIWMGAGPVPEILHLVLNLLAKVRAGFRLPPLTPFARLFYAVLNAMRFGEHRGGMFIRARGLVNGEERTRSWHLLAEGDDGPFIPSMAIEAIIRKLMAGIRPAPGARPATNALELGDYEPLFQGRAIFTGFRNDDDERRLPLYPRILGSAYGELPSQLQSLHGSFESRRWAGIAEVRRGKGTLARIIAAMLGFPKAAREVPLTVTFEPTKNGERWTRDFGGKRFSSVQAVGMDRNDYLLVERFGIVRVAMALVVDGARLFLVPRRWSVMGIPMPGRLLPAGTSFESEVDGQFRFDVDVSIPRVGLVAAYRGRLTAQTDG